jgi:hypothetical protein
MEYFSDRNNYIDVKCKVCGKILKIEKIYCKEKGSKYYTSKDIKCICGNKSSEIIKKSFK